jgi:tetratricopeptide (TPR) repeat protein
MSRHLEWLSAVVLSLGILLAACGGEIAKQNNAGNKQYNQGNYAEALRAYHAAQVAGPDRPEAYFNAAAALIKMQAVDDAVAALEQSLQTADDAMAVAAYYNLGNIFFDIRFYELAIEAYQAALLLDPDADDVRYNMELAMLRYVPIAPTDIEQQTNPESGFTDPNVTPTPDPGGHEDPTPTPPQIELDFTATPMMGEGGGGGEDSSTPIPQSEGQMTVEEAERLLDQIQQDQQVLREFLRDGSLYGLTSERDW